MTSGNLHTILLVEDEYQQREVLASVLEAEGYTVVSAESAEAATQHIENITPSLIVTDVKMPGMDGFSFFDRVRSIPRYAKSPFIFITGYNDLDAMERVKQLGAAGYVTKPYEIDNFLNLVKQVLSPEPKKL
jgi:CheY-like chemotaxis protein